MKTLLVGVAIIIFFDSARAASINRADRKSIDCFACQYIMKIIRHETLQGLSPSALKEKLRGLSKVVPATMKDEEYLRSLDALVTLIQKGEDVHSICKNLGKCTTLREERPFITECQVCTTVVKFIKLQMEISNTTLEVITEAVIALCAIIGDVPVYEECKLIVNDIKEVIQWIEDQLSSEDICVRLGLCPNATMAARLRHFKTTTCNSVVRHLRIQNRKGWSAKQMKRKIAPTCKIMGLNRYHCYRIEESLKTVLTLIKRGDETDEVCGNRMRRHIAGAKNMMKISPSNYCDFCMIIVETVDTQLGDAGSGLPVIEGKLKDMCDELENLTKECKYVVDFVFEDIRRNINYIEGILDPSATCKNLKLCPKQLEG